MWQQSLRSESPTIYRAEFLAYELFQLWVVDRGTVHVPSSEQNISLEEFRAAAIDDKAQIIREVMQSKHSEGFQRGVHDEDTVKILTSLLEMHEALGILRFSPAIRGSAEYAWFDAVPDIERQSIEHWIQSHRKVSDILRKTPQSAHYARAVSDLLKKYASDIVPASMRREASKFLFIRLFQTDAESRDSASALKFQPLASNIATRLVQQLHEHLPGEEYSALRHAIATAHDQPARSWVTAIAAIDGFLAERTDEAKSQLVDLADYKAEVAALLLLGCDNSLQSVNRANAAVALEGLIGDHPRVQGGRMVVRITNSCTGLNDTSPKTYQDMISCCRLKP